MSAKADAENVVKKTYLQNSTIFLYTVPTALIGSNRFFKAFWSNKILKSYPLLLDHRLCIRFDL